MNGKISTKCSIIRSVITKVPWIRKVEDNSSKDVSKVRQVIADLNEHKSSNCTCCPEPVLQILYGINRVEEFHAMLNNVIVSMEMLEDELKRWKSCSKENINQINDISQKDESRFNSDHNGHFNKANFNILTAPVIKALICFEEAFNVDQNSLKKCLNERLLCCYQVFDRLNSLFQIFNYYDLECFAIRAVTVAMKFAKSYCTPMILIQLDPTSFNFEPLVATYCNFIRQYLNFGYIQSAKNLFLNIFGDYDFEKNIDSINNYIMSIAFLLHCDILCHDRKWTEAGVLLKKFINSEYLSKLTLKRIGLKIMAYSIITQVPSCAFDYHKFYVEFIEPFQLCTSLCRRWSMLQIKDNKETIVPVQDTLWFRFTVYNLINSIMPTLISFYMCAGMISDAAHYHRIGCVVNIDTLNLVGFAKLQILAASLDQTCAFYNNAKMKIFIVKSLFQFTSQASPTLFDNSFNDKSINNEQQSTDGSLHSSSENITLFSIPDAVDVFASREEAASKRDPYEMYQKLMNLVHKKEYQDDFDDLQTNEKTRLYKLDNEKLVRYFWRDLEKLNMNPKLFKSVFFLFLHCLALEMSNEYIQMGKNDKNLHLAGITSSRYHLFLQIIESYFTNVYNSSIKTMTDSIGDFKSFNVKANITKQFFCVLDGSFFWFLSREFVAKLVETKKYKESICYLDKLTSMPSYSFPERVSRSLMFYYRSLAIFELINHNDSLRQKYNSKEFLRIYSGDLQLYNNDVNDERTMTPPPKTPKQTRIPAVPGRPKDSIPNTIKKYGESLLVSASKSREITVEGTRRLRFALNFDEVNHSEVSQLTNGNAIEEDETIPRRLKKLNQRSLNICIDTDQEIDKIVAALGELKLSPKDIPTEDDRISKTSLFSKMFDCQKALETFDEGILRPEEVFNCISKVISYIGHTPPSPFYSDIHHLLFKVYRLMGKSTSNICYHLVESIPYVSLRYRSHFVAYRRDTCKKDYSLEVDRLLFSKDLFCYKDCLNDLPSDWRFVHIKVIEKAGQLIPDLFVIRFERDTSPVYFKIKYNKEKTLKFFLGEFHELIKEGNASLIETNRDEYWKLRFSIDERLRLLLDNVENQWFGFLRGILLGKLKDKSFQINSIKFKRKIINLAETANITCVDLNLFNAVVDSVPLLSNEDINACVKILFDTEDPGFLKQFHDTKDHYFKIWRMPEKANALYANVSPVGLILDPVLNQFPFESMPIVRRINQPFFRVPSLQFAATLYKAHQDKFTNNGIEYDDTFYVVNPSNNLASTQSYFEQLFNSIKHWKGVIGNEPNPQELAQSLEKKNLYIYFGHGSGSVYYRAIPDSLDSLNIGSVAIVMGCSSGRNIQEGKNELFGVPYRFLLNGAPCYVGNLWDVTDKDIDKYSNELLALWSKSWPEKSLTNTQHVESLPRAVAMARNVCKLKHLIGSAPVVYGLPILNKFSS